MKKVLLILENDAKVPQLFDKRVTRGFDGEIIELTSLKTRTKEEMGEGVPSYMAGDTAKEGMTTPTSKEDNAFVDAITGVLNSVKRTAFVYARVCTNAFGNVGGCVFIALSLFCLCFFLVEGIRRFPVHLFIDRSERIDENDLQAIARDLQKKKTTPTPSGQ